MKNKLLILPIILLLTNCGQQNYEEAPTTHIDEKCYEKCMKSDQYLTEFEELTLFTGNRSEDVDLEYRTIEIAAKTTKWVKTAAGLQLTDIPAQVEEFVVLTDTSQSPNFRIKKVAIQKKIQEGGTFAKTQVVCDKDLTPTLINQVQDALRTNGYYQEQSNTGRLDTYTLLELRLFKKEFSLPCGEFLDVETLEILGIFLE